MTSRASIVPSLLVSDGKAAVAFYRAAFGAVEIERFEGADGTIFSALDIDGARIFVGDQEPTQNAADTRSTVAIDLLVNDPVALQRRAVLAGAIEIAPIREQQDSLPLGRIRDPFGHTWLIGSNQEPLISRTPSSAWQSPVA